MLINRKFINLRPTDSIDDGEFDMFLEVPDSLDAACRRIVFDYAAIS